MANAIYPKYKEALLSGASNVSLTTGVVKISLIDTAIDTYSSTDQYFSDLNANSVLSTETMIVQDVADGTLNANDVTFTTFSDVNVTCEALLIWIDTTNANTSPLVAWMDTNISGLPVTTSNSSSITVTWNTSGIFRL